MDRFVGVEALRNCLDNGDVKLLKATWLLDHLDLLQNLDRQKLEELHPDALVEGEMVGRLLNEVDGVSAVCAKRDLHKCMYPPLVVVSHCWNTRDSDLALKSKLLENLPRQLRWYAAQRAKYTRSRLYGPTKTSNAALATSQQFDWDFGVVLDLWSLFQPPRTVTQEACFARWLTAWGVWYGHAGTMKFLLREAPEDGRENEQKDQGREENGNGLHGLEEQLALLAGPRHCVDMCGFEEMLSSCTPATQEQLTAAEIRSELGKSVSRFERKDMAVEDKEGWALSDGSCLRPLRVRRQRAPIPPAEVEEELRDGASGRRPEELQVLVGAYREAAAAAMAREEELRLQGIEHWEAADYARLGRCMALYTGLRSIHFTQSGMGDVGLAAFVAAIEAGSGSSVQSVSLSECGVTASGMAALAEAVGRGALAELKAVYGARGLDEAEVKRAWRAAGRTAKIDGGIVNLTRGGSCCAVS